MPLSLKEFERPTDWRYTSAKDPWWGTAVKVAHGVDYDERRKPMQYNYWQRRFITQRVMEGGERDDYYCRMNSRGMSGGRLGS